MSVLNPLAAFYKTLYGQRVVSDVTTIAGASTKSLFTVAGGRVVVTSLVGEVTTIVQAQANATKLTFNPDGAGATSDLCATLDINGDAVGLYYGVTGDFSDAMTEGVQSLEAPAFGGPFILSEGVIGVATAANSTGAIQWTISYVPLDDGASIVSA